MKKPLLLVVAVVGAGAVLACALVIRAGARSVYEVNFPRLENVPLSEFHAYGNRLGLLLRIDEKLLVDRDGMAVVFAGMARDQSGRPAFMDLVLKDPPDQSGVKALLHEEVRGRHYFAIGRHPDALLYYLKKFTGERQKHDPFTNNLLDTDEGVLGIKMPGSSTDELLKRFGSAEILGYPSTAHSWRPVGLGAGSAISPGETATSPPSSQPPGPRLTVEGSKTARGVYSVDFIRLSEWQGSLNSALKAARLPLLPTPLGGLTWRESSAKVKKALGLSEKNGTREFCPAMLPQIGKADVFCRLAWDAGHRLDEVQFSSVPLDQEVSH